MPNRSLTGESLAGLVSLLSDGLEHPLLIVKKRAINLSTISINKNILGDVERNKDQCDRLIMNLSRIAQDPPYHPGLNLGEGASFCISMLPPKTLEIQSAIDLRKDLAGRIASIIQRGYNTRFAPDIILAQDVGEFKTKLDEHTQKKGDDLHFQFCFEFTDLSALNGVPTRRKGRRGIAAKIIRADYPRAHTWINR
jgi:hypothetical protein